MAVGLSAPRRVPGGRTVTQGRRGTGPVVTKLRCTRRPATHWVLGATVGDMMGPSVRLASQNGFSERGHES